MKLYIRLIENDGFTLLTRINISRPKFEVGIFSINVDDKNNLAEILNAAKKFSDQPIFIDEIFITSKKWQSIKLESKTVKYYRLFGINPDDPDQIEEMIFSDYNRVNCVYEKDAERYSYKKMRIDYVMHTETEYKFNTEGQ